MRLILIEYSLRIYKALFVCYVAEAGINNKYSLLINTQTQTVHNSMILHNRIMWGLAIFERFPRASSFSLGGYCTCTRVGCDL